MIATAVTDAWLGGFLLGCAVGAVIIAPAVYLWAEWKATRDYRNGKGWRKG